MTIKFKIDYNKTMDKLYIIIIAIVFILLIMAGLAVVNYSGQDLVDKYKKYSTIPTTSTPIKFVEAINALYFNNKIRLKFTNNELGDSYNSNGTMTLCEKYAYDHNLVGITICAHELGHAFQFEYENKRMKKFMKRNRTSRFLSKLTVPLFVAGIVTLIFNQIIIAIVLGSLSLITFMVALINKYMTIKVEKDASKKAMELIVQYAYFTDEELKIAKDFLNSAKQTYIADLLRSMLKWTLIVK